MLTVKESQKNFFKLLILFIAIVFPWIIGTWYVNESKVDTGKTKVKLINYKRDTIPKVDHTKFDILKQDFKTPQDVTKACLSCHNLTHQDIMKTSHWKWTKPYVTDKGDTVQIGKKNILNNFCIGVTSNEPRCTSCHIGYGYKDNHFDFTNSDNIDCLICHDMTGTYKKFPTAAGYPVTKDKVFGGKTFHPPDYNNIAQHVGTPKKQNCGACHFVGGGGNNVKHGDIANEINNVTKEVDVHMAVDGARMECVDCHKTEHHNITGNLYSIASTDTNRVSCEQCHSDNPHVNSIINQHTRKIACQTCHIPTFAKVSATKMYWDWSTAGKFKKDGSLLIKKDSAGNMTYHSMKGSFIWKNNVTPEYYWFNGKAKHYVMGDKIDPTQTVQLNRLLGDYNDPNAKIVPVKVHRGKQIYDSEYNTMIVPHLFGKDSTAYWKNFDWDKAARTGMEKAHQPYSGHYGFVSTEMYWPINHMVAQNEEALKCNDCHSHNSRLNELTGFYLPGRDNNELLDYIGWGLLLAAFAGVLIHALLRIIKK